MGWKVSALIVRKAPNKGIVQLAIELGLSSSLSRRNSTLNMVLYPDQFYIGFYNDCTIITHSSILSNFFDPVTSQLEKKVSSIFKDCEILAIGQVENAGISGFSLILKGNRVRTIFAGEEEGIILSEGAPLSEETSDIFDLPFVISKIFLSDRFDSESVLNTAMSLLDGSFILRNSSEKTD